MNRTQRPGVRWLLLAGALLLWAGAVGAVAAESPAAADVWRMVDAYLDDGDLPAAVEALEEAKVTPALLRETLTAGRPYPAEEPGRRQLTLTDGFGRETEAILVVPPRYEPDRPVGVILCLHGLGGSASDVVPFFQRYAAEKYMIVAAPTAQGLPPDHPNPDTEAARQVPQLARMHCWSFWRDGFPLSLLRQIGRTFNVDHDRVVVTGFSMGGFGTWNLGLRFPDRFAALIPIAGGISYREYLGSDDVTMRSLFPNLVGHPLYFVHGDADPVVPVRVDRRSDEMLRELGDRSHVYVEVPGAGHLLPLEDGGRLMSDIQDWLARQQRGPPPRELRHVALHPDHGAAHWISMDEITGQEGRVEARWRARNRLEVQTEGVSKLTVRLSPELVRFSRAVSIQVNGKSAFKKKVKPSLESLLQTWRAAEDPALLYDACVPLELKE